MNGEVIAKSVIEKHPLAHAIRRKKIFRRPLDDPKLFQARNGPHTMSAHVNHKVVFAVTAIDVGRTAYAGYKYSA